MATPEANTILAQQLFRQPAEDYAANSAQRLKILMGIAQATREEQLKRDLATQQATREDARWAAQGQREDIRMIAADQRQTAQNEAISKRQDVSIRESERRQKDALKEHDAAAVKNEFDKLYLQYAIAAAQAHQPVKQRTDFTEDHAGLGQLSAELATARIAYTDNQQKSAAELLAQERDARKSAEQEARDRLSELSKPAAADVKIARAAASNAVAMAITNKEIPSATKLRQDAIDKGLAALHSGNDEIAKQMLGDDVMTKFRESFEQTLYASEGFKARMQEKAQAQQQLLAVGHDNAAFDSNLLKAAAANPYLAEKLTTKRDATPLRSLMGPPAGPRPFSELFSATGAPQPGATPAATTPPPTSGVPVSPVSTTMAPATSILGLAQRFGGSLPTGAQFAAAPANILAVPGRAIDTMGRYGAAGLQGLWNGDYTVPDTGLVTAAGNKLGSLMAGNPYDTTTPRSLFGADNPGRQADIDRAAALIQYLQGPPNQ